MTWFEFAQLVMAAVPSIMAVLGGILVAHKSYARLQYTVAALVESVDKIKPQAQQIAELTKLHTAMKRDIIEIKDDIKTIRGNQQAAAHGRPETGDLERLHTEGSPKASPPEPTEPRATELEDRVGDLEDGVIKDLRIHKVDDPPED